MNPSAIVKVSKLDDGTVHEVFLEEGRYRCETFYKPTTEPINPYPNSQTCLGDLGPLPPQEPTLHPRQATYSRQNGLRLMMIIIFVLQYLALILVVLWPVNPYFVKFPRIRHESQMVPSRVLYLNPVKVYVGCYDTFFCMYYNSMPVIKTSNVTFYPNFTDDSGNSVNYMAALSTAFNIIHNKSCSNYQFLSTQPNTTHLFNSSRHWNDTEEVLSHGLFLWKYNCHPEALELTKVIFPFGRFGLNLSSLLPPPQPSSCSVDWTAIKKENYTSRPGPQSSNCPSSSDLDYLDFVDGIEFLNQ